MEFSLTDPSLFIHIFDIYKQYSDNIKMYFDKNGIHLQAKDDANISILDIRLNHYYFDTYKCTNESTIDFDLKDMCKVLKICKKSKINLLLESNILKIITFSNNIKKVFKLNSIYTNYDLINIDSIVINNSFELDSSILKSVFDDFILFSNEITIKINNSDMYFYSNDTNIDTKYYYNTQSTNHTIENNITLESTFSLDYLHKFKLIHNFKTFNIKIDNDTPIFLSTHNRDLDINFILAPKMSNEIN